LKNQLALRIKTPEEYVVPMKRLGELGVQGVETFWPEGKTAEEVRDMVEPHGVKVTSITVRGQLGEAATLDSFRDEAEHAKAVGAKVLFAAMKHEGMTWEQIYDRLRQVGDVVKPYDVRVAIETHPELCHNGDRARETLTSVDHPNVRLNFDTANVYYYNEGVTTMGELAKVSDLVASVHLKETDGGHRSNRFGIFGSGVVDFAGVFDHLNGLGFYGPFTMELEGPIMASETEDEMAGKIEACVNHLRGLGKV
jgi:inosose dehydratase